MLLFLKSIDLVKDVLASGQAVQAPSADGVAVTFQHLPPELGQRIHEADACLGCFIVVGRAGGEGLDPAGQGLFEYSHLRRTGSPARTAAPPGRSSRCTSISCRPTYASWSSSCASTT